MAKISIIIPAYNEVDTIRQVIADIRSESADYNIIVIDDGSTDITAALAANAGAVVLRHLVNRGQGAALKTGTDYAIMNGADVVVHFDADGQFLAGEIKDVVAPIITGEADIVFGSRFLAKKSTMPWFKKHIILRLAKFVNRIFLGVNLSDPQSGFRAFSREAAKKLNWQQDRMAHCSEIMHLAFKNKLRVREVPMTIIYHNFGQRLHHGFKILGEFFLGIFTN